MPKPSQSWFKRFFYNQNIKRDKSNDKYKNLLNHIVLLLKKTEKEGMTKWVSNAFARAQLKVTSYGISFRQVLAVLEHKGIAKFEDMVHQNLFFVQKKGASKSVAPVAPQKVVEKKSEKKASDEKSVVKKVAVKKSETSVTKKTLPKVAPKTKKVA